MSTLRVSNITASGGTGTITVPTGNQISQVDRPSGLVLVKTQTIGTAVSSVTVSDAFSADFENYQIVVNGGTASTSSELRLSLGSSNSGYYGNLIFARPNAATPTGAANSNTAFWQYAGLATTNGFFFCSDLSSPFLSVRTSIFSKVPEMNAVGANGFYCGWHDSAVSYTAFTVAVSSGTITGGTIRVYGYRN